MPMLVEDLNSAASQDIFTIIATRQIAFEWGTEERLWPQKCRSQSGQSTGASWLDVYDYTQEEA